MNRYQVISQFPHVGGSPAPKVASAEFATRALAESHKAKVEQANKGVRVSIVDRKAQLSSEQIASEERAGFSHQPFASLLAGFTV